MFYYTIAPYALVSNEGLSKTNEEFASVQAAGQWAQAAGIAENRLLLWQWASDRREVVSSCALDQAAKSPLLLTEADLQASRARAAAKESEIIDIDLD
jgi:hypothetical protein